ncbi:MAG: nicotinate-nucleotide--dimethylbenzimidazole phosphoribosyltransferase [Pseudomonadota bacterium]
MSETADPGMMTAAQQPVLADCVVAPRDAAIADRIAARWAEKTMPPGALGRLITLGTALGVAQHTDRPQGAPAEVIVFAGDHGLVAEGVSAWPQAVTALMVETLAAGDAAASVMARSVGARLEIVDVGVATPYRAPPAALIDARIRAGTRNALHVNALTPKEVTAALTLGAAAAERALQRGARVLVLGEMGIGNTAAAALLAHAVAGLDLETLVGPGAGLDAAGVAGKRAVLERVLARHDTPPSGWDGQAALSAFGGLEIAAMAGGMIGGAAGKAAVIVDGFIATAAALVAVSVRPEIRPSLIFAHRSAEPGHRLMLDSMSAAPVLDLDLRLGEGTGGIAALPMVAMAARLLEEMATFESAGISRDGP